MAEGLVLTVGGSTGEGGGGVEEQFLGDVVGPASSEPGRIAVFADGTGKEVEDGGQTIADVIAAATAAPPAAVAQNTFLVSGGALVWVSAYTFRVSAATYYVNGLQYAAEEQSVTLSASHATLDRIDVISVDNTGAVVVVEGTAASQPSEPDVDPSTQLKLGVVLVKANTTALEGAEITVLWAEHAGSPTEWAATSSGTGWTLGSTNSPKAGTKSIEGTNVAKSAYLQLAKGSGVIDLGSYDSLVLYIKSKATWSNGRGLRVQWHYSGTAKGTGVNLTSGFFGFNSANTTDYQLVVIPISQFAVPAGTNINQLRLTDTNGAIGFYLDDISLQKGIPSELAISALTQNQADALYVKLPVIRKVGFTIDGGGAVIETGDYDAIQLDFAGTIIGWSLVAPNESGSVTVEVSKVAGTQTLPVVPDTTTHKISASAPMTLSDAQGAGAAAASLTGWTTTVAQWDSIRFKVASVTSLTKVVGYLRIQQT